MRRLHRLGCRCVFDPIAHPVVSTRDVRREQPCLVLVVVRCGGVRQASFQPDLAQRHTRWSVRANDEVNSVKKPSLGIGHAVLFNPLRILVAFNPRSGPAVKERKADQ